MAHMNTKTVYTLELTAGEFRLIMKALRIVGKLSPSIVGEFNSPPTVEMQAEMTQLQEDLFKVQKNNLVRMAKHADNLVKEES